MKRTIFASLAIALMTSSVMAGGLDRCQDLPDIVTPSIPQPDIVTPDNAPVNRTGTSRTGVSNHGGTTYTKTAFCPAAAAPGTCTGESLSEPVAVGTFAYVTLDGVVADIPQPDIDVPDILVHQTGKVDVKESAKAYVAAVLDAIKNGDPIPKPGPQYEVVDWNAPTEGSHC